MCIHTISIFSPQEMEEPTRVSKGKAGGEKFLSKEVMNSCNGSCHAKRSFFQREKKICEIGRK